jgi:diguanylate cyclase (GGDEF)-like protein
MSRDRSSRTEDRRAPAPIRWFRAVRAALLELVDSGIPDAIQAGDSDVLRRARIILSFALVLVLLGVESLAFFSWALSPAAALPVGVSLLVGLSLTLAIPTALRRSGSLETASNLLIAGSYIVIVTSLVIVGGIRAPLLHWTGLLPMLAVLMGTRRSAVGWTVISFATLGAFVAAENLGWRYPDELGLAQIEGARLWVQRIVDVGSWIAILFAIATLYEARKEEQTRLLAHKNVELESEIDQRSRAEERNQYLAHYDDLTALPNRRLFQQQLENALEGAATLNRMVGVLFLDLDGFKEVNDTHGHALGDRLLQQVAQRLRGCIRMSDSAARGGGETGAVVSRLGGDEFTVLLAELRTHQEAALVAHRILRTLERSFELGEHEVFISASIGIAIDRGGVDRLDDLLRSADLAMYHAKEQGRNNFQFFEESMNADVVRHGTLAAELRRGIDRGEFSLGFQPIVDARTRRITGVEALARWNHPEQGEIAAGEFIEVAEESGLVVPLGDWVVREACRAYVGWRAEGIELPRLAINVSGAQLRRSRIVDSVLEATHKFEIDPACLELEVTEGAMMLDEDEAGRCLAELKRIGLHLALDDFGTGFSSLSYVKRFPVDALKIDRTFVSEIDSDPEARAIATAIIAMAHQLGLRVVGEGVETVIQEQILRAHGCDELQGYRYGRPLPAAAIGALILANRRLPIQGADVSPGST